MFDRWYNLVVFSKGRRNIHAGSYSLKESIEYIISKLDGSDPGVIVELTEANGEKILTTSYKIDTELVEGVVSGSKLELVVMRNGETYTAQKAVELLLELRDRDDSI